MSASTIGPDNIVVTRKDVFFTSVSDDLVIFDANQGTYFGSGLVGQQIWSIISEEKSVKVVCDELLEQFAIDRPTCEKQVLSFLSDLKTRGLIEVT